MIAHFDYCVYLCVRVSVLSAFEKNNYFMKNVCLKIFGWDFKLLNPHNCSPDTQLHAHTNKHFQEKVKLYSGYFKTVKTFSNRFFFVLRMQEKLKISKKKNFRISVSKIKLDYKK